MALLVITQAYSQVCKKVTTFNGYIDNYGEPKMVNDSKGNIYMTGGFTGSLKFDSVTLNSKGESDIFVAKFTPDRKCVWAVRAGGKGYDGGHRICFDRQGNIYFTGYFSDTAKFGNFNVISMGDRDIFVAKYNNKGECLWVKSAGTAGWDEGFGINTDNEGNIYVSGNIIGKAIFGNITTKNPGGSFFLAKYDDFGNCLWVKAEDSMSNSSSRSYANVTIDNENIYLTGIYFSGTLKIDTLLFPTNTKSNDLFVVKFDKSGRCLQGINAGGGGGCLCLTQSI